MKAARDRVPVDELNRDKPADVTFGVLGRGLFHVPDRLSGTQDDEFQEIGLELFESEDLTDALLQMFLALCADGWSTGMPCNGGIEYTPEVVARPYHKGFYLPCVPRVVLSGQVDLRNDPLPAYAGLVHRLDDEFRFAATWRCRVPGWVPIAPGEHYLTVDMLRKDEAPSRRDPDRDLKDRRDVILWGMTIKPNGEIWPQKRKGETLHTSWGGWGAFMTATTLNAVADSRLLWQVRTNERVLTGDHRTPITLGVGEEHVKSLFYARQGPRTESGRRRPILHWVRAHQRRLAAGIDIDVSRHLRGLTEFEMDGFPFSIANPAKPGRR